jgi:hypothetical protein
MIKIILVLLTLWAFTGCIFRHAVPGKHGIKGKNGIAKPAILIR